MSSPKLFFSLGLLAILTCLAPGHPAGRGGEALASPEASSQRTPDPEISSFLIAGQPTPKGWVTRTAILNTLAEKFGYQSYLEIGQGRREDNFDLVDCRIKIGVDPNRKLNAAFQMTSDEFFAMNKLTFDLIFIDGLHLADQVERDILNSLDILNRGGTVVVHDCNPPTEEIQMVPPGPGPWTGDVWKAWVKLRAARPDLRMYVVDVDYGCGIIRRKEPQTLRTLGRMTYRVFDKNRVRLLNLVGLEDFLRSLKEPAAKPRR